MNRWKVIAILAALVLVVWAISGCTHVPNPGPCPALKEYPKEFVEAYRAQIKATNPDGMRIIPEGSPVAVFMLDAELLRRQVRACQ